MKTAPKSEHQTIKVQDQPTEVAMKIKTRKRKAHANRQRNE